MNSSPGNCKATSSSLSKTVVSLKFPLLTYSTPLFSPLNALFHSLARYFFCQTLDKTSPLLFHDFTDDEIEVANILVNLKTLIPLYEPPNLVPSTPIWLSKRPRSALVSLTKSRPDRLKGDSAAVAGNGNCRNVCPDSPLLLKSSPERCCVQGGSGSTRDKKEAMGGRHSKSEVPEPDFPDQVDATLALCGQLPVSQLALANGYLTDEASPHGSARTSLTSPRAYSRPQFLFDLNLLPESTVAQSTPPDEKDRKLGQTTYNHAAAYDGSSQSDTAEAARKRRLEICRMKNGKCATSEAHPSLRH